MQRLREKSVPYRLKEVALSTGCREPRLGGSLIHSQLSAGIRTCVNTCADFAVEQ